MASAAPHGLPATNSFSSAADVYRPLPQASPEFNYALSPDPTQSPPTSRHFLPPTTPPSGHPLSFSYSRTSLYRVGNPYPTNTTSTRAFALDPSAGLPLSPSGQLVYSEQSPPPSTSGHGSFYNRRSVDDMGVYRTFNPANRTPSMASFAPPPAPWMRSENGVSRVSMASTAGRASITPKKRPPHPSALLKGPVEKPWLNKRDPWATASWWITVTLFLLGVAGSAVLVFFGVWNTPKLGNICQVMHDDFNSLDTSRWQLESELGGFGNGEFEMTTQDPKNAYTEDGKLYIVPTLTEDEIGSKVYDGGTYTLDKCTTNNQTACTAASSEARKTVINPVQAARINTKGMATIGWVSSSSSI